MTFRTMSILSGAVLLVCVAVAVWFFFRPHSEPTEDKNQPAPIQTVRYKAPRVIAVQAIYPGANAQTVADMVAAPIEEQVSGVEGMQSMSSQSANDGSYTLYVTFKDGTDLDMAMVLVQNRVSLALPVLPTLVQVKGVTYRKKSPQPLLLVSVTSPDGRFDSTYLSNYVTTQIKDDLARLPGVGDIVLFGERDYRLRVWLDVEKMAAQGLSGVDVAAAIAQQNVQVAAGQIGQQPVPKGQRFQLTINTQGRLIEREQFADIILKATPGGGIVRVKDVALVDVGGSSGGREATLNGNPAVVLAIYPVPNARPRDVSRAVADKLTELRANLPEGLALASTFDFTPNLEEPNNPATPAYLVVDVELPESASQERTIKTLDSATQLLRKTPGVSDVLALTEHPFSLVHNRPCLVVRLSPKDKRELDQEELAAQVRGRLQEQIPEAMFRLSVPSAAKGFPVYGFPIEFVIEDCTNQGHAILRQHADALVEEMSKSGKFQDASDCSNLRLSPNLALEIDRTRCEVEGVGISEIFNTLQVYLGSHCVENFQVVGRTWQVNLKVDAPLRAPPSDILRLQVRNGQGQLVQLGALMKVRGDSGPLVIERHNMYTIARVTANLSKGVSLKEAKELCESLTEAEFDTRHFKWTWLTP